MNYLDLAIENFNLPKLGSYPEEFSKVQKKIAEDLVQLVKYFLIVVNLLEIKSDEQIKAILDGFGRERIIQLRLLHFKYHATKNALYKKEMERLITPFIQPMTKLVFRCQKIFTSEEDTSLDFGEET